LFLFSDGDAREGMFVTGEWLRDFQEPSDSAHQRIEGCDPMVTDQTPDFLITVLFYSSLDDQSHGILPNDGPPRRILLHPQNRHLPRFCALSLLRPSPYRDPGLISA
jgi:hypothetical protein